MGPDITVTNSSDRRLVLAIMVFSGIAPAVQIMAPGVALQLAREFDLSATRIGWLFAAELGAMTFATIPAFLWLKRVNWRSAALVAGIAFALLNIGSALLHDFAALIVARTLSGLAGGSIMVITLAAGAQTRNQGRTYGLWLTAQFVVGAAGLALLPFLFGRFGIAACYGMMALLMLLALPLTRHFPVGGIEAQAVGGRGLSRTVRTRAAMSFAAIVTFYIGLSGVWSFIGFASEQKGMSQGAGSLLLAIATLIGIVGASLASVIGDRFVRSKPLLLGYALMAGSIVAFASPANLTVFLLATLTFKFTWTFTMPFILATLSALDEKGRLIAGSNLAVGFGLTAGPAVAGQILDANNGDFQTLLWIALTIVIVSAGCALFAASPPAKTPQFA